MLFFLISVNASAAETTVVEVEPVPVLSAAELKELVGPIALYPDDLLAIVLPASTFPLQIVAAARFRADAANANKEPDATWDESIVALLNYPEALALLNDDIDWTWSLGEAVLTQETEVMQAVQAFRQEAYAAGNIDSDDKQTVTVREESVVIEPVTEEVVYVPYYEPAEVLVYQPRRVYYYYPTAYPLYYYPYDYSHRFYYGAFWGISSYFTLSWVHHNLHHYNHHHRYHRYYGHRYAPRHFGLTRHYRQPRYHQRRFAHRRHHDYAFNGHWRPHRRHVGPRPGSHRSWRQHRNLAKQKRHVRRTGEYHYRELNRKRGFRDHPRSNDKRRYGHRNERTYANAKRHRSEQRVNERRVNERRVNERKVSERKYNGQKFNNKRRSTQARAAERRTPKRQVNNRRSDAQRLSSVHRDVRADMKRRSTAN